MMPVNDQVKAILELIQNKIDVSMSPKDLSINIALLEKYPDSRTIMRKLAWLDAISISHYPNEEALNNTRLKLIKKKYSSRDFDKHMSYRFSINTKFTEVYSEYIELNPKGVRTINENEVMLTPSNYDKHIGLLKIGPYHEVEIAQRGKTNTTMDIHTKQCILMEKLFRDEKHLIDGISLQYARDDKYTKILSEKEIKQVKNLLTEINNKFTDVTNLKKLVIIRKKKVRVNPIYLL